MQLNLRKNKNNQLSVEELYKPRSIVDEREKTKLELRKKKLNSNIILKKLENYSNFLKNNKHYYIKNSNLNFNIYFKWKKKLILLQILII